MSEWTRPSQPVRFVVELDKPLSVRRERWMLAQGDASANAIIAEVYQTAGKPFDMTGCTVMLTFVRPDNLAVPSIRAEISGNQAIATLTDDCYGVTGMYVATMQLRKNGTERTILWIIGDVKGKDHNGVVDNDRVIPSLEDLMATAAEAQAAVSAANAAAEQANSAAARAIAGAQRAEQLQLDASGLAGDSNKLGGLPASDYLLKKDGLQMTLLWEASPESLDSSVPFPAQNLNLGVGSLTKYKIIVIVLRTYYQWTTTLFLTKKCTYTRGLANNKSSIIYRNISSDLSGGTLNFQNVYVNGTEDTSSNAYLKPQAIYGL